MKLSFIAIVVRTDNYMYLFYKGDIAFCVDPYDPDLIRRALGMEFTKQVYTREEILGMEERSERRRLVYSFTTHGHSDHADGNKRLKMESPDTIQVSGFEETICKCGDRFSFDGIEIECLSTFCHTQDSFCYYVNGEYLVTGDTLFFLGCGRFFEGTAKQMIQAIEKIKDRVSHQAILLYGHDYNRQDIQFAEQFFDIPAEIRRKRFLMLEEEVQYNPFFNLQRLGMEGIDEEIMDKLRKRKDSFKAI